MSKKAIPENVKKQADAIVQDFNRRTFNDAARYYTTRYRGSFLYLDRYEYGLVTQICRLKYVGVSITRNSPFLNIAMAATTPRSGSFRVRALSMERSKGR